MRREQLTPNANSGTSTCWLLAPTALAFYAKARAHA
jgi:hypothetical protein